MALVMFLFASFLGLIGAVAQLVLGADVVTALNTYALLSIGLPMVTLMAMRANRRA